MKIQPIIVNNPIQNIFYILEYGDKQALLIDPCDAKLCQIFLDKHNLKLEKIFITHEHHDHFSWVEWLECSEIYAGKIAAKNMPISVTHIFQDEEVIFEYEDISIKAIFTPGHAAGHMMFELSRDNTIIAIFSGDVLFQGGIWNTRSGNNEDLFHSVQKFINYGDDVIIYSGHDYLENNAGFIKKYIPEKSHRAGEILRKKEKIIYFTNLWEERSYNPFIWVKKEEFIKMRELRNNY